jgi:hypothetical protein
MANTLSPKDVTLFLLVANLLGSVSKSIRRQMSDLPLLSKDMLDSFRKLCDEVGPMLMGLKLGTLIATAKRGILDGGGIGISEDISRRPSTRARPWRSDHAGNPLPLAQAPDIRLYFPPVPVTGKRNRSVASTGFRWNFSRKSLTASS